MNLNEFFPKITNGFTKLVYSLVLFFVVLIFGGLLICTAKMNWNFISVQYTFSFLQPAVGLFLVFLMTFPLIKQYVQRVSGKGLLFISYAIIVAVSLIFIFGFDPNPSVDAETVIEEALLWQRNGSITSHYMQLYPYQLSIISLLKLLLSIFSSTDKAILVFRLFNVASLCVINYIVFKISFRLTNYKIAAFASLLLSLLVFPEMLTTFIYGDLIGYASAFVSLYLCIKNIDNFSFIQFFAQLLTLFLGIFFRIPTVIIGIVEVFVILIYFKKNRLISILITIAVIYLGNNICAIVLENIYHIKTYNLPLIARTMMSFDIYGMGVREPGWITSYTVDVSSMCQGDAQCISNHSFHYLNEVKQIFIDNPSFALNYLSRKFYSQWLIPDFEGYSLLKINEVTQHPLFIFGPNVADSYFMYFSNIWMKALFILIIFGTIITLVFFFKLDNPLYFALVLSLCGCFGYYWIGEVKARYVLPYVFFMIPLLSMAISKLLQFKFVNSQYTKKSCVGLIIAGFIFTLFFLKDYKQSNLPVLKIEAYTETQELQPLIKGNYYQIPISIDATFNLANVSLLLSSERNVSETFLQIDFFDNHNELIASNTVDFNYQETGLFWKEIPIYGHLEPGNYILQVSSSNKEEIGLNIVLGEQFGFINQEYLQMNGFETNLRANYKLYQNHY